jgi:imidazolonepropionase-like amidohydrolase
LATGFSADFIMVKADPVSDPTVLIDLNSIEAVYQNGRKVAEKGQLFICRDPG